MWFYTRHWSNPTDMFAAYIFKINSKKWVSVTFLTIKIIRFILLTEAYKWFNFLSNKFFSCTLTFCNNNWNVFKELHIGLVFRTRLKTGVLFVRNTKCRITLNRIRKITLLKIKNSTYIDEKRDLFSDYILVAGVSEVDQVSKQIPKMLNANKRIQESRSCWQQCPRNKSKFMSFNAYK